MAATKLRAKYAHPDVAAEYDARRFESPGGQKRNLRKIAAIRKALARIGRPRLVLDVPCGTGRLFGFFRASGFRFVGADISPSMLREAAGKFDGASGSILVVADAEALPFANAAFDVVFCIRFLFHLAPDARIRVLREMARVTSGHLVIDYRLRYCARYFLHQLKAVLGLRRPLRRPKRKEMLAELAAAGIEPLAIFAVTPVFSDKHIVLGRPIRDASAT
jgi:ubiquinone/menaquinone biosynthesis C-methylase UbiE